MEIMLGARSLTSIYVFKDKITIKFSKGQKKGVDEYEEVEISLPNEIWTVMFHCFSLFDDLRHRPKYSGEFLCVTGTDNDEDTIFKIRDQLLWK